MLWQTWIAGSASQIWLRRLTLTATTAVSKSRWLQAPATTNRKPQNAPVPMTEKGRFAFLSSGLIPLKLFPDTRFFLPDAMRL